MQKRLDIACSLVHSPRILILDEPTADLDIVLRRQMWDLVKQIREKGTTVIISSHFLDEIETLCDSVAILHNSKIIVQEKIKTLKKKYSINQEIHIQTANENYEEIENELRQKGYKIKKTIIRDNKMIIYSAKANDILKDAIKFIEQKNDKIIEIKLNEPTLNEIFESLTSNVNYSTAQDIEKAIQNAKENQ